MQQQCPLEELKKFEIYKNIQVTVGSFDSQYKKTKKMFSQRNTYN